MPVLWINFKGRRWKPYYLVRRGKVMKTFLRREALLRTVVFFAAALVLAACNHQSVEGGPKTTQGNDKDQGNGNGGGGGGY